LFGTQADTVIPGTVTGKRRKVPLDDSIHLAIACIRQGVSEERYAAMYGLANLTAVKHFLEADKHLRRIGALKHVKCSLCTVALVGAVMYRPHL
jgi:hypothetical protein